MSGSPVLAMGAGWNVQKSDALRSAAVYPIDDVIEHDIAGGDACECGPRVELVEIDVGGTGWVYIHHSVDGRERFE